jgi:hypothetical protein
MRRKANTPLRNIVQAIIDAHKTDERIDPVQIATEAMEKLDAAVLQKTMPQAYFLAHLQLRHMARLLCRKQFDKEEDALDPDQQRMFPGLQARYRTVYSGEESPNYVLREAMTSKDVEFNVRRLREEGASKLARASALQAWWEMEVRKRQMCGAAAGGGPMPIPESAPALAGKSVTAPV